MNQHGDEHTVAALVEKLHNVACYATTTSMAYGILASIRANQIPSVYHGDAIPDYMHDAMIKIGKLESENKEIQRKYDALKTEVQCAWVPLSIAKDKRSLSHACADVGVSAKNAMCERDKLFNALNNLLSDCITTARLDLYREARDVLRSVRPLRAG